MFSAPTGAGVVGIPGLLLVINVYGNVGGESAQVKNEECSEEEI